MSDKIAVPQDAMALFNNAPMLQPIVGGGSSSPYLQFFYPLSKKAQDLQKALGALKNSTPVYVDGNEYTKLDPLQFVACPGWFQFGGKFDNDGELLEAVSASMRYPQGFSDCINAVLLVWIEGSFFPARCRFKGPKCPAMRTAANAIMVDCAAPDFAGRSKEHKLAAASKLPQWAWLYNDCTVSPPIAPKKATNEAGEKTSPYETVTSIPKPITAQMIKALQAFMKDEDSMDKLTECLKDAQEENLDAQAKM